MNKLIVFAKHWTPGQVKTRLAASVGADAAAAIYREFIRCTTDRMAAVGNRRSVCVTPKERANEFRQVASEELWSISHQSAGDLGERMARAFSECLQSKGKVRAVIIGSDSPDLPAEWVVDAFE
ncbi:MAG: DUF2064 domain-containing protein, partial [Planctomycetales bacterium]|nr:DUF2064 domain-containing protein [Planctomycetales bacterium]